MHFRTVLVALLLGAASAQAQVVSPLGGSTTNPPRAQPPASAGTQTPPPAAAAAPDERTSTPAVRPHHARRTLAQRFDAANTTHDGKLTLEQARAGRMVAVARDFDQIDKAKHGYVTLDDIKTFQTERRAARRAARTHTTQ